MTDNKRVVFLISFVCWRKKTRIYAIRNILIRRPMVYRSNVWGHRFIKSRKDGAFLYRKAIKRTIEPFGNRDSSARKWRQGSHSSWIVKYSQGFKAVANRAFRKTNCKGADRKVGRQNKR